MRLLVLGGTVFLGRFVVETALNRGHDVTVFNRGRHESGIFPNVDTSRGVELRAGLSRDREVELLRAWHEIQ